MTDAARFHDLQPDFFTARPVVTVPPGTKTSYPGADAVARRVERRTRQLRQDLERVNHSEELRKLEPLAIDVASRHPTFTMADVRDEAERLGWLTGEEGNPAAGNGKLLQPRALAYLGALLPGLARIGFIEKLSDPSGRTVYETSARGRANGNKQVLWRITDRGRNARIVSGSSLAQLREAILAYRESGICHG